MKSLNEVAEAVSPEVRSVINQVLKIHQEGKHYRDLPVDMERDFCERIIKVIMDEIKT